MPRLVHHPHAAFGVIRADPDPVRPGTVRTFEQVIPLVPDRDQVAVAVNDKDTVLPCTAVRFPQRVDPDRPHETGEPRRNRVGQTGLAPLDHEDAVWRLGEHAGVPPPREPVVRKRLQPAVHNLIRTRSPGPQILKQRGRGTETSRDNGYEDKNGFAHDRIAS